MNETIYLVDDNKHQLELLDKVLNKFGYRTISATSGYEMLESMASYTVDLVLIDQIMPGLSGYETYKTMKQRFDKMPPVIMMSAVEDLQLCTDFLKDGGSDFIQKPIYGDLLHFTIQQAMDSQRTQERADQEKKARIAAQELERLKSDFLENISHEFRNPLNSIIGFVSLALAKADKKELQLTQSVDYLHKINRNTSRLKATVNDFLDLSRIESGVDKVIFGPISIPSLFESLDERIQNNPMPDQLEFKLEMDENLPRVTGDFKMIKRILVNLLDNAIKFTSKGRVTILAKFNQAKRVITISIEDTGIGIDKDDLGNLFNKYVQMEQRSPDTEGTGLGLVICFRLASLLGTTLEVESVVGQGTKFSFTLNAWRHHESLGD